MSNLYLDTPLNSWAFVIKRFNWINTTNRCRHPFTGTCVAWSNSTGNTLLALFLYILFRLTINDLSLKTMKYVWIPKIGEVCYRHGNISNLFQRVVWTRLDCCCIRFRRLDVTFWRIQICISTLESLIAHTFSWTSQWNRVNTIDGRWQLLYIDG